MVPNLIGELYKILVVLAESRTRTRARARTRTVQMDEKGFEGTPFVDVKELLLLGDSLRVLFVIGVCGVIAATAKCVDVVFDIVEAGNQVGPDTVFVAFVCGGHTKGLGG